jgi:hypothetical protein
MDAKKFEVPEGYESLLLEMTKRELAYLKDKKSGAGVHFKEDNMIHQLKTFIAANSDGEEEVATVSTPVWSKETYN